MANGERAGAYNSDVTLRPVWNRPDRQSRAERRTECMWCSSFFVRCLFGYFTKHRRNLLVMCSRIISEKKPMKKWRSTLLTGFIVYSLIYVIVWHLLSDTFSAANSPQFDRRRWSCATKRKTFFHRSNLLCFHAQLTACVWVMVDSISPTNMCQWNDVCSWDHVISVGRLCEQRLYRNRDTLIYRTSILTLRVNRRMTSTSRISEQSLL